VIQTVSFWALIRQDQTVEEVSCLAYGGTGTGKGVAYLPIQYGGTFKQRYGDLELSIVRGTVGVHLYADTKVEVAWRRISAKGAIRDGTAQFVLTGYLEDLPPTPVS
jgi:hypothetical protein